MTTLSEGYGPVACNTQREISPPSASDGHQAATSQGYSACQSSPPASLPMTGFDAGLLGIGGAIIILVGIATRRMARLVGG